MAKRIRVSSDSGSNYYTLPGNSGEFTNEAGEIDDTIFGQDFSSAHPGLIGWGVNANAVFKGYAGYLTTLKKIGTSTALTAEAMSVVTGKTYQVTDATKRLFNVDQAITILDDASPVAVGDIESIDYLFGRVTFASGYTVVGDITVTGYYYPLASIGCANGFTLTQTANANNNTCMDVAQGNSGHHTYEYGLKTVSMDLQGIFKIANGFRALLAARTRIVIEVDLAGDGETVARGFFRAANTGQSGDVGDIEQETITFNLSVPEEDNDLLPYPFAWLIGSSSTMSTAVQKIISAWQTSSDLDIQYLYDGTNGVEGTAIITDVSLAGGLEVMNEFTANFQGSGAPATV